MSKIGKQPISMQEGVSALVEASMVKITGPKGEAVHKVPRGIQVTLEDNKLIVTQQTKGDEETKAIFGLTRALLANMVKGAATGFEKKLELVGVGYRAQMQGTDLVLSLGFSHPVKFASPAGITIKVAENVVSISGPDKMMVGQLASQIRAVRPPEPYKGKGIKYSGEIIRKKAGKAAKGVGGK